MVDKLSESNDRTEIIDIGVNRRQLLKTVGSTGLIIGSAGCSSSNESDGSNVSESEVHFLTDESSDPFRDFFATVKEDFESETDYTVRMEYAGVGGSAEDRLAQLTQSSDPPEVFLTGSSQAARFLNQEAIAPISDAFSSIAERLGEPEDNVRLQTNNNDYIAPLWGNIGINWYRTDIWGGNSPDTWSGLLEGAKNIDESSDMTGSFVPAGTDICTDLYLLGWAYSNGARVCARENGRVSVVMNSGNNRQRWVETLRYLQNLHQYSSNNSDAGCSQMSQALASESSAQSWYVGSRPKYQSISQGKEFADKISATTQPTPETEQDPMTIALAEGLVTFANSNTTAANEYIDFLFQPKYLNEIYFLTPLQNVPAFPEVTETQGYQDRINNVVSETAITRKDIDTTNTASENIITLASETDPPNPYSGAILGSRKLSELVYDVTVGNSSPEEALETRASEIQDAVDEARN
jgi:ABC-type sugar transport system, periplasmic component